MRQIWTRRQSGRDSHTRDASRDADVAKGNSRFLNPQTRRITYFPLVFATRLNGYYPGRHGHGYYPTMPLCARYLPPWVKICPFWPIYTWLPLPNHVVPPKFWCGYAPDLSVNIFQAREAFYEKAVASMKALRVLYVKTQKESIEDTFH